MYTFLTDAQLRSEMEKCEYCSEKPCRNACPANCSPADFIMAARMGNDWDIGRAAAEILRNNPLGGVCGMVCPDYHCMRACVHEKFDSAVDIPKLQATIIARAKARQSVLNFAGKPSTGKKIAIIGAGPAGLAGAAVLAQNGYDVHVFESGEKPGGACQLIPEFRLPAEVLRSDIDFLLSLKGIQLRLNTKIEDPAELLKKGHDAVMIAVGLWQPIKLGIMDEEAAIFGIDYLMHPIDYSVTGKVAVIGGGATACDCALSAKHSGAAQVEMIALETVGEMPLTRREKDELIRSGVDITGRTKLLEILASDGHINGIRTTKVKLPSGAEFNLRDIADIPGTQQLRSDIEHIIIAIGARSDFPRFDDPAIFYAGDYDNGPTSVVEAVASGKNAALSIDAFLSGRAKPMFDRKVKSTVMVHGYSMTPVSLETDFFGRRIHSPLLLSASPLTDGFDQMKSAYDAGWPGAVMKTAFDHVSIHIPADYMHVYTGDTYGNCDNVSGHSLDRVCAEIERLRELYPDRLTIGSTGGSVTGNDEIDRQSWQSNTRKLEAAGAMAIEYSLSCPQGGDGSEGDIVSQNASLSAKIIDWIMATGHADVPKLFKLTGAVTSIIPIVTAIKAVFDRYPDKKAGITLANSFPTLFFRQGAKKQWEEGIVVGMSGEGVLPISYLTLATVAPLNVVVSGNGGPMDYKAAADFLALGARTVQFCTIALKYGYQIYDELASGLSHLMEARGMRSVTEFIGIALPDPIVNFMELSAVKRISDRHDDLCLHCGNCTRCPYQAVRLDDRLLPGTDASRCIGCSLCVQKCFSGALFMRDRSPEELSLLSEE